MQKAHGNLEAFVTGYSLPRAEKEKKERGSR
jgi:hypothetical protein